MAKKKSFGNLSQVDNMGGLKSLITDTERPYVSNSIQNKSKNYVVKTFNIANDDFQYLKKYVKYRRMQGDTDFTQKEALGEAIKLLKSTTKI